MHRLPRLVFRKAGGWLSKGKDWGLVDHGTENLVTLEKLCREKLLNMEKQMKSRGACAVAWCHPVAIIQNRSPEEIMRRLRDPDTRTWWGARPWKSWEAVKEKQLSGPMKGQLLIRPYVLLQLVTSTLEGPWTEPGGLEERQVPNEGRAWIRRVRRNEEWRVEQWWRLPQMVMKSRMDLRESWVPMRAGLQLIDVHEEMCRG